MMSTRDVEAVPAPLWSLMHEICLCGYDDRDGDHLRAWKYENYPF